MNYSKITELITFKLFTYKLDTFWQVMSINTTVCLPANAQDQFYKSHNLKLNCHQQSTTSNMVAFKSVC